MTFRLVERWAALAAALVLFGPACSFDGTGRAAVDGGGDGDDDGTDDDGDGIGGRIDAAVPDAQDECVGWQLVSAINACGITDDRRGGVVDLDPGNYTYDTATGVLSPEVGQPIAHNSEVLQDIRYLSAENITIQSGATLRVVGDKPLLIVAWNDLTVAGEIDASSRTGADGAGAGADPTQCLTGGIAAGPGGQENAGGGGGGGGGLGAVGGAGGRGDENRDNAGTSGDIQAGAPLLRGGCKGGDGGGGNAPSAPVAGGRGGGAVAVVARVNLTVTGLIQAGGGGGVGGDADRGGGGGGGSGGVIWLAGGSIELGEDAILTANGGGGGEGAAALDGAPGDDAPETGNRANGGTVAANGGDGGDGSTGSGMGANGTNGDNNAGGGGGGGGGGMIVIDGPTSGDPAVVTPPFRNLP